MGGKGRAGPEDDPVNRIMDLAFLIPRRLVPSVAVRTAAQLIDHGRGEYEVCFPTQPDSALQCTFTLDGMPACLEQAAPPPPGGTAWPAGVIGVGVGAVSSEALPAGTAARGNGVARSVAAAAAAAAALTRAAASSATVNPVPAPATLTGTGGIISTGPGARHAPPERLGGGSGGPERTTHSPPSRSALPPPPPLPPAPCGPSPSPAASTSAGAIGESGAGLAPAVGMGGPAGAANSATVPSSAATTALVRPFSVPPIQHAAFAVGGEDAAEGGVPTVERYDLVRGRWEAAAPMQQRRGRLGLVGWGPYAFAMGGRAGNTQASITATIEMMVALRSERRREGR